MAISSVAGRRGLLLAAMVSAALGATEASSQPVTARDFPSKNLTIIVPANPGGGWDGTARAVQEVLRNEKIAAKPVDVVNVPGGGGTVGLAQLIGTHKGDGHTILMTGLTMVGAVNLNKSPVNLSQTTPLVRLTAEYPAIVVSPNSKFKTLQELLDAFKKDPSSVVWAGGPGGGPDHTTVGLIASKLGVPPAQIRYTAFSGGEGRAMIMGNQVSAGVLGLGEISADVKAGLIKVLGVPAPERIPGTDFPTLKESGLDLEFANWRGFVGPPDMPAEAREAWTKMLTVVRDSQAWKDTLAKRNWMDAHSSGDEFTTYVKEQNDRIAALFKELGLVK
jgi:putative tricarboxylic transport membrane protein